MNSGNSPEIDPRMPMVGIIVLNWRGLSDTLACLASLEAITYPNVKTIVVENGSCDGSAEVIRREFPEIIVLEQDVNRGYAGGNNIGIEYMKNLGIDYVLLLNNDAEVEPVFLTDMVATLENHARGGIAGPTIYYFDQPDVIWSAGGRVDWTRGETFMIGIGEREQGQYGLDARPVEWITGCTLLMKMVVIEQIGGLDERFFAYYEESEFCIRAGRSGWHVLHVPTAKVWHKISPVAREASPQVNYYMTRNRLLFMKLIRVKAYAWVYALLFDFGMRYMNWLINPKWRGKKDQRRALLRAMLDYCRGRFGKVDLLVGS
jgi:GT2 family glycosyltransferase